MRVVHVIDLLIWGGAQKLLVYFAEEANRRGVEMDVIALRPNWSDSPFPNQLKALGISVITLNIRKLYDPRALPALVRILKQGKYDVVQTHLTHSNILGVLAGKIAGLPVIATLHTTNESDLIGHFELRRRAQRFILRRIANRVVAVANSVADAHQEKLAGRIIDVIPNAVAELPVPSNDQRLKLRSDLIGDPNHLLILTVGRLIQDKGMSDLIDAFSVVLETNSSIYLLIVGDGELFGTLIDKVKKLKLEKFIGLSGARDDAAQLIAVADVYVSSSHREGLSIALLEAMSAGLPILATSVGETRSLLTEGRGVLVSPKDTDGFARELSALIINPALRTELGNAARKYVQMHYSLSLWMDRLLSLYSEELKK